MFIQQQLYAEFYLIFLSPQHTRMGEPTFPEHLPSSHQILHIPPQTNRAGGLVQPCPNLAPREPPEPQPTTSTTRGTWTSSMFLIRACLGKTDLCRIKKQKKGIVTACVGGAD